MDYLLIHCSVAGELCASILPLLARVLVSHHVLKLVQEEVSPELIGEGRRLGAEVDFLESLTGELLMAQRIVHLFLRAKVGLYCIAGSWVQLIPH